MSMKTTQMTFQKCILKHGSLTLKNVILTGGHL